MILRPRDTGPTPIFGRTPSIAPHDRRATTTDVGSTFTTHPTSIDTSTGAGAPSPSLSASHVAVVPPSLTSTTTVNTAPFFPDPTSVRPPPSPSPSDGRRDLAKSVLAYVFLGVALFIIVFFALRRLQYLKRTDRPLRQFFFSSSPSTNPSTNNNANNSNNNNNSNNGRARSYPRQPLSHTYIPTSASFSSPPPLSDSEIYPTTIYDTSDVRYPIYASLHLRSLTSPYHHHHHHPHHNSRRTRAADVDEGGRRLDSGFDDDGDKEMLPAYDRFGGPPKYVELENLQGGLVPGYGRPSGGGGEGQGENGTRRGEHARSASNLTPGLGQTGNARDSETHVGVGNEAAGEETRPRHGQHTDSHSSPQVPLGNH
ncbi:hypothetical protein AX17_002804 [Amanita inopinata Kibby_2008]|nr:hypothetical protein AX17_002804 [Amanita inopinata Kibby_2008]